ncbi:MULTISPECIES: oxygenase MpaB family protein [Aeromicrobium]|uniref:oxygenase MpaB family protein n=1 Tax=Aeromicrobium TaxID=2040 RepID=UPI00257FCB38|nr:MULTISPECIES: oxygenase MpaB family protein [Aeromicrobium]
MSRRIRSAGLDPAVDYEEISRLFGQYDFPWDLEQSLSFALFRTYAVPSIGRLLYETGQFTTDTQRRHDDTALLLGEIVDQGLESDPGRAAVRRMNQMHGRYGISNDDMRYVLATFVVMPNRWVNRYGWRRTTPVEDVAGVNYYLRLGRLMGIRDLPDDLAGFERLLDAYETEHFRFDPRSRAVADATLDLLTTFYPRPLAPAVRRFSVAIMDPHLRTAFGYDHPPAWFERLCHGALCGRGRVVRFMPERREPRRVRDSRRIRSYPGGFLIEELGT